VATLRYDVDVDTTRAERRVGAFALDMRSKITKAVKALPDIELDANSTAAQREIARIRAELVDLGRKRIGIDIDATAARTQLTSLTKQLGTLDRTGDIRIDADISAAVAALGLVDHQMDRLDGRKAEVKVDVDKSLSDTIVKIGALGRGLQTIALPVAAVGIAPTLASIGAVAASAAGAVGLFPAALGAAALAVGTLKIGMTGFDDVLKAIAKGDAKAFAEQVAKLAPAAQTAAVALRDLAEGPFKELRLDVQQRLFAGLGSTISTLAEHYLPVLRTAMGTVATAFNTAAKNLGEFLDQASTRVTIRVAMGDIAQTIADATKAIAPLARAFVDVFAVGASVLRDLTGGIGAAAQKLADFVHQARESGRLREWIQAGIDTFKELGVIAKNVGSALMSIFRAAAAQGEPLLDTVRNLTEKLAEFLKSAQGQSALIKLFEGIRAVTSQLVPMIEALAPAAAEAVKAIGQGLGGVLRNLTPVVEALAPLFEKIADVVGNTVEKLANALGPQLKIIAASLTSAMLPVLDRLGDAFATIADAMSPMIGQLVALVPVFASVAQALTTLVVAAAPAAAAFASTLAGALKIVGPALTLVSDIIHALEPVLVTIAPYIGAVASAFLFLKAGLAGLVGLQGLMVGFAKSIVSVGEGVSDVTTKMGASAGSAERVTKASGLMAGAVGKVASALPLLVIGLVGVGLVYDSLKDKSDELARAVIDGSTTYKQAIEEETKALERKSAMQDAAIVSANEGFGADQRSADGADLHAQAVGRVDAALQAQLKSMDPVKRAQAEAKIAQDQYNEAIAKFPAGSPEVLTAQANWVTATQKSKIAQDQYNEAIAKFPAGSPEVLTAQANWVTATQKSKKAAEEAGAAVKTLGERVVETANLQAGIANADLGYRQAVEGLAKANAAAATAVKEHGAKSVEARDAFLNVESAQLAVAGAAQRKGEADAKATGATNVAEFGARAYKDELLRLADQADGKGDTSTAKRLRGMADGTNLTTAAADTATRQSGVYKDQLGLLAEKADGPMKDAMIVAGRKLDDVANSSLNAHDKTREQIGIIDGLIQQSSGPLRTELEQMRTRILNIPDKTSTITVNGVIGGITDISGFGAIGGPQLTLMAHGGGFTGGVFVSDGKAWGIQRAATGGVLPGYTPGRDVHRFSGPTGSLELSGGEAIMRPEWTRAVGEDRVNAWNTAASRGGVVGARKAMSRSHERGGVMSFATGGLFKTGENLPHAVDVIDRTNNYGMFLKEGTRTVQIAEAVSAKIRAAAAAALGGNVLEWVKSQLGKPYLWATQGPNTYDCSGFVSAAINVMQGRYPYTRLGSTGSMPWAGMRPGRVGTGGGINVGAFTGNPGHMAADVNGVNIECSGGRGVTMGAAANGANSSMFNMHYFMPGDTLASAAGGSEGGPVGLGVARWAGTVAQALNRVAQSQAYVGITLSRMQKESGGNPNAINNWDSNAARGTPSKGLMQVIDPTFAAYRDRGLVNNIWDPLANITSSMKYALARYGSLPAAYNRAGGYDAGGIAAGTGWMHKSVLAPERVLSPAQTAAFERLVGAVTPGGALDIDSISRIAASAARAAVAETRRDGPATVVQWQAREPLGHADLVFVASETARVQAWQRRRDG
jgi:hypothetical protein